MKQSRSRQRGILMLEAAAAMAVLAVLMVAVAQTSLWVMRERTRNTEQRAALELAENTLEGARAQGWDGLTAAWSSRQKLSSPWTEVLPEGRLLVQVEQDKAESLLKRVTVEVRWEKEPSRSVKLVGLFSARTAVVAGGKTGGKK